MTVELSPLQWQFAAGLVAAALVYLLFPWVVQGITRRTASDLDDILVARLRGPLAWTLAVVAT